MEPGVSFPTRRLPTPPSANGRAGAMILEPGQTVGTVMLLRKVADIGAGSVWAGEDTELQRPVAVKFLGPPPQQGADVAQRFTTDAPWRSRAHCPYLPDVVDEGHCPDGTPYVVLDLVEGIDLTTWLAEEARLDLSQVARLTDQVASALSVTHGTGVVHRDVKPENILVTDAGGDFETKLVDYALRQMRPSRENEIGGSHELIRRRRPSAPPPVRPSLSRKGGSLRPPCCLSPEQIVSPREIDGRSDMWSLAVVVYWCLTDRAPFEGDTFASVCAAIQNGHFRPVTEVRPELPDSIDAWFVRALAREPDDRFESADLMAKMFRVATARAAPQSLQFGLPLAPAASGAVDSSFASVSRVSGVTPRMRRVSPARNTAAYVASVALAMGTAATVFVGPGFAPVRSAAPAAEPSARSAGTGSSAGAEELPGEPRERTGGSPCEGVGPTPSDQACDPAALRPDL